MLATFGALAAALVAPPVPASTPAALVALATRDRITGAASYAVTADGSHYRFDIAQRGTLGRARFPLPRGVVVWVGFDASGVTFVCRRNSAKARVTCRRGDPTGDGLRVISLAGPVANDYLQAEFAPLTTRGRGTVTQSRAVGRPVSCLSGRVAGERRSLCVTSFAIPTRVTASKLVVKATRATPQVKDADIDPPAPLPTSGSLS